MTRPFGTLLVEDLESDILLVSKAIEKLGRDNQLYIVKDGENFVEFFKDVDAENNAK